MDINLAENKRYINKRVNDHVPEDNDGAVES